MHKPPSAALGPPISRPPMPRCRPRAAILVCTVVAGATFLTYWPVLSIRALWFDDDFYFHNNYLIRTPSWASVGRFFGEVLQPSTVAGYYQPLTMVSLMLDAAAGATPDDLGPVRRTSLALHAANAVLVAVLMLQLFGSPMCAAACGMVFGLHPLSVESVAWIAERKTLLATFFALVALTLFVRWRRRPAALTYAAVLLASMLTMLAKPTTTPLPVLMLALDFWPLRRPSWRALATLTPMFGLSALFAAITYVSQARAGGVTTPGGLGMPLIVLYNFGFYVYRILWPANIAWYYPMPSPVALDNGRILLGASVAAVAIGSAILARRKSPAVATAVAMLAAALLPTLGIVGFTTAASANRFAYFPSVAVLILLASGLNGVAVTHTAPAPRRWIAVLAWSGVGIYTLAAATLTRGCLADWRDTGTLTSAAVSQADAARTHIARGNFLLSALRIDEALVHYQRALQLEPDNPLANYNLANALLTAGRAAESIACFERAIPGLPQVPHARVALAKALRRLGRDDAAAHVLREAAIAFPSAIAPKAELGDLLLQSDRAAEAVVQFEAILNFDPDNASAHVGLGNALTMRGDAAAARPHFERAIRLDPNLVAPHVGLGVLSANAGDVSRAEAHFMQATLLNPDSEPALRNLAAAQLKLGHTEPATKTLLRLVALRPADHDTRLELGRAFRRLGRTDEAVAQFNEILRARPDHRDAANELHALAASRPAP